MGVLVPYARFWSISLPYLWSLNVLGWVGNNGIRWRLHIRLWKRPPSKSFWKASLTRIHASGWEGTQVQSSGPVSWRQARQQLDEKERFVRIQAFQIHQQGSSQHIDRYWSRKYDGVESRGQRIWIAETAVCGMWCVNLSHCAWIVLKTFGPVQSGSIPHSSHLSLGLAPLQRQRHQEPLRSILATVGAFASLGFIQCRTFSFILVQWKRSEKSIGYIRYREYERTKILDSQESL